MEETTTVGIDLAKEVCGVCALDHRGAVLKRKVLQRRIAAPYARKGHH